jgi:hypothetical protein
MNRRLLVVATLSLALPLAGIAQSTVQPASLSAPMSSREARGLMKTAHSAEQYRQLAAYFHQQEAKYRAEAASELVERDRRAEINRGMAQKYPRPVDSAQYLYESYVSSADSAALQAEHYDQLVVDREQQDKQQTGASRS